MMPRKRKASSPVSTDRDHEFRRRKLRDSYVISSSEDEDESDELGDEEYPINCILDEDDTRYLIDWEGPWSPTWEPKDCANDVAIEVWEEKKRKRASEKKKRLIKKPQTQPPPSNSGSQSSEHSGARSLERQPESRRSTTRRSSPLFVSPEAVPETQSSSEADRSQEENRSFTRATTVLSGSGTSSEGGNSSIPETVSSNTASIFEYIPASPVPTEYRLPGESGEPVPTVSQSIDSSVPSAAAGSDLTKSSGSVHSQGVEIRRKPRLRESGNSQQHSPSEKQTVGSRKEVVEIAETPSAHLSVVGSQVSRVESGARDGVSQVSSNSANLQSYPSSIVSQVHPPSKHYGFSFADPNSPLVGARLLTIRPVRSVPESVSSGPSQRSVNANFHILQSQSVLNPRFRELNASVEVMDTQGQDKEVPSLAATMEKYSHVEGSTPREKLKNAYAQLLAKRRNSETLQTPSLSATPSSGADIDHSVPVSIPDSSAFLRVKADKEPATHPSQSEIPPTVPQPLVPRPQLENTEHPAVQTIQPSALTISHVEEPPPGSVQLGPSEFAVPLPMDSRVKDDYDQVLTEEAQSIQEFLNSFDPNSKIHEDERDRLVSKMRSMIERLNNITTHPDLNIAGHIKGSEADLEKEASWAEYSSAKFLFLGYVVEIASPSDIHLIVMVQGGKGMQAVERYLLGKGLVYTRPRQEMGDGTNVEVSMMKGSLSFGIQSTQNTSVLETYKRPSAVIALGATFNAKSPSVEHIRTTYARHGSLLPVIRLLVSNSSEHIGHCFPNFPELERLRLLIRYTLRLRDSVGDLQDDALGVHEDAEEVLSWLLSDNFNANWPLPAIEPLQIAESGDLGSTLSQHQNDPNAQALSAAASSVQKRLSDMGDAGQPLSKRQRMGPSQDVSQLTESSKFPSQTLDRDLQALEVNLIELKNAHAVELNKLQKALADTQLRLKEKDTTLGSLQHRYESQTREFHKIRQERDRLAESKRISDQRIERQKEEITKLKDERTQLKHDLEAARDSLKVGGGSMAELEAAREEIRRLTKDNAGLERKAEYEKNQAEYTREQYQTASKVAAQSGNEIRQLKQENETLRRKVAGEASRLKEINLKNDESHHLSRIAELEGLLESREQLLHRKETELREIRKNRPSTRATSIQPRSPKFATNSRPSSPGIVNRGSHLRHSSEPGNN